MRCIVKGMAFVKEMEAVVLGVLQNGPRHGYEIARRIREIDEGALNAREGRLYPLLHRLEAEGVIGGQWVPQEGRPPRKVYSLTAAGWDALTAHRAAWRQYAGIIESALGSSSGGEGMGDAGRRNTAHLEVRTRG